MKNCIIRKNVIRKTSKDYFFKFTINDRLNEIKKLTDLLDNEKPNNDIIKKIEGTLEYIEILLEHFR